MSQRSRELLETESAEESEPAESESGGRFPRLRGVLPGVPFSPKRFGLAVGLLTVGIVAGGWVPFVGTLTQYAGLFLAAFLLGVTRQAGYLETGSAGAVAAGVSTLLGVASTGGFVIGVDVLQRYGLAIGAVGVSIGLLLALAGIYFGRDLRAGLTRSV